MTRRNRKHADGSRVAITALECLHVVSAAEFLGQIVRVARGASEDRNVRVLHRLKIAVPGDPNVTCHAVARVNEITFLVLRRVIEL